MQARSRSGGCYEQRRCLWWEPGVLHPREGLKGRSAVGAGCPWVNATAGYSCGSLPGTQFPSCPCQMDRLPLGLPSCLQPPGRAGVSAMPWAQWRGHRCRWLCTAPKPRAGQCQGHLVTPPSLAMTIPRSLRGAEGGCAAPVGTWGWSGGLFPLE